jgi:hypothetical protein
VRLALVDAIMMSKGYRGMTDMDPKWDLV